MTTKARNPRWWTEKRCGHCGRNRRIEWLTWACQCEEGEDKAEASWLAGGGAPGDRSIGHWHGAWVCVVCRQRALVMRDFIPGKVATGVKVPTRETGGGAA